MNTNQSLPASKVDRRCLVGGSYLGLRAREKVHTPKTWLAGFLLITEKGRDDLIATGNK